MGAQRTSFAKLQRDRAKKAKAEAKRAERQERLADSPGFPGGSGFEVSSGDDGQELSAPELLAAIERIHRQFEAKAISYEDFEEKKAELIARLPVD
ncbi:MAG: hypothetical protein M3P53_08455 [Actinomycetota bacterium]|nr:hypothetical protein [Actinomycetota bacterium]